MTNPDPEELAIGRKLLLLTGWGKRYGWLKGGLVLLSTAVILYLLFRGIGLQATLPLLKVIPLSTWAAAAALTLTFPILMAWRWHIVLSALGVDVPVRECLLIVIGVWPLSAISPSKVGDLLRAVGMRDRIQPVIVAGSVITERALDVFILALFAAAGGLYFHMNPVVLLGVGVLCLVALAFALARSGWRFPIPKLAASMDQLLYSTRVLLSQPRRLLAVLSLTMANWMASILQTHLLFAALQAPVPFGFTMAALPAAVFVGLMPITISGMGTRDSAMVYLFSRFADPSKVLAVSLLYTFFGYWLLAILGIAFTKRAMKL